jgi:integrase
MAWVVERPGPRGVGYKGCYRGPDGAERSAGTYRSKREALRAANREEQKVLEGRWRDASLGAVTFKEYVEKDWLPTKHIEPTTKAAYQSNLNKHFFPFFGERPMAKILPSSIQAWVTNATSEGLSPKSVRNCHVMLHSISRRAVRDQLILTNPCEHTELPKVIARRTRTLTPKEFGSLIAAIPQQHRLMIETAIETGMRWGELIALRPRHIDFLRRTLTIEETIIEVSRKHSPTGERRVVKPYPKDNEPRTFGVRPAVARRHGRAHEGAQDRPRRPALSDRRRYADLSQHIPDAGLAARGEDLRDRLQRPHARSPPRPRLLAPCWRR